jgi:hypothetical protein
LEAKLVERSREKLIFLTSAKGPIFKGEYLTIKEQCNFINKSRKPEKNKKPVPKSRRKKEDVPPEITSDLIRRWRRNGVRRASEHDRLHMFCEAARRGRKFKTPADDLVSAIVDDDVALRTLAGLLEVEGIEAEYIVAEHGFGGDFPDFSHSQDIPIPARHDTYGIYRIERRSAGHEGKVTLCLAVFYNPVIGEDRRWAIFGKLFVPKSSTSEEFSEYNGLSVQRVAHRYFFFQGIGTDRPDYVTIVTDDGAVPVTQMFGYYLSVNIDQHPGPGSRQVKLARVSDEVTDELIARELASVRLLNSS